jgi:mannose-6-phosphate isomerase-like protein (cupin superfamily)
MTDRHVNALDEEEHVEAESRIQAFHYKKPNEFSAGKASVRLCNSDVLMGLIQVVQDGGENNLHYHKTNDGFWLVLGGRARFYGPGDEELGEFGPHEGIFIPRGARYWFERVGDEELEILRVGASAELGASHSGRTDVSEQRFDVGSSDKFDGRVSKTPAS